ncbi:MAG: glucuronate isomerase, partial [Acholeplasma sp.]
IIDYHCHLDPKEIFIDKSFRNITDAWLSGDHYKWRLMRAHGISEDYITGNQSDQEKFKKWAEVVPHLIGNPLYHWTHLELKRFFGIDTLLSPKTAEGIYQEVNHQLSNLSVRKLIEKSHVELICTTDDPIDSLEWHKQLQSDPDFKTIIKPAFRPDKAVNIDLSWFNDWIDQLQIVVGHNLNTISDLKRALIKRIDYFHMHGSRLSDHGLDVIMYEPATEDEINQIYRKRRQGETLSKKEVAQYRGNLLIFFGKEYHKRDWVQQYHIGALRNVSTRHLDSLGPDTGFDAINDQLIAEPLACILNELDKSNQLPKTILYTLNPRDFEVAVTIMGAFQGGGIPGKIQFGSAWWFLDTIDGMTKQMKALANNGLLSRFVGMLTDSRSYLSYPRHEYFRRLVCHIIGDEVEQGLFPYDETLLGQLVQDICYYNAKAYFGY